MLCSGFPSQHSKPFQNIVLMYVLYYISWACGLEIWHGLPRGCFYSTQSQLASLGDVQLVAGLEGTRQLNSRVWHPGMDSWEVGLSWALSRCSWGFLTKSLSKAFVLLKRLLRVPTVCQAGCFQRARQELQGFLWPSVRSPRASFLPQSIGQASQWKSLDLGKGNWTLPVDEWNSKECAASF